jgi:hypothetical protein
LHRVLALGATELGLTHELDVSVFAADKDGFYGTTFAVGTISYAPSITATLYVIKLGLMAGSPQRLKDYRFTDRGYPHHKTSRQWYGRQRMESYRDLGFDSTVQALKILNIPA